MTESGFNAMGNPIPNFRKQNAYTICREVIGLDADTAWSLVEGMSNSLERDMPYEAMKHAEDKVDITGSYRIMAYLLTGEEEWKPIETAPRDGTWFIARTEHNQVRRVRFADKYDRFPISEPGKIWNTAPIEWKSDENMV